jgi:hypothetical protein
MQHPTMAVWRASNKKKVRQTAISICIWLPHQARSLSRIVCRGQEDPKCSKGMQLNKDVVRKSRYS